MLILIGLSIIISLTLFCVAPGRVDDNIRKMYSGRNYAHRGLHTEDHETPENSLASFSNAVSAGYGIEFDVHITADDHLVVIHDNNVKRMCGLDGIVENMTLSDLRKLRLGSTNELIPTFNEVLDVVSGSVPIIIELKSTQIGREARLCQLVAERMDHYSGIFCIESFDPRIVAWFRKNRPSVVRGQLVSQPESYKGKLNPAISFLMYSGLSSVLTRPHFIAHHKGRKIITLRLCEFLGAMRFIWTIRPDDDIIQVQGENDGVIFELYRPEPTFF